MEKSMNTNTDTFRDFFSQAGAEKILNTKSVGKKICFYDVIDSTNNEAKRNSQFPHGTVFLAEKQTEGRGRLGREWISDENGLWLSILLKPDISLENVFQITLITGLVVCKIIRGAKIKWPNDIVLNNKKVCGILTEMSTECGRLSYVVTGIGINVNARTFPDSICEIATSVYLQTGKEMSRLKLFKKLCSEIEKYYELFEKEGFAAFREEYKKHCITLNREVLIKQKNTEYIAFASDIDKDGQLLVKTEDGVEKVLSGEVSVRGIFGYI